MPLLKKKAFPMLEPPKDLDPNELVYQVRFTKEIFRDYQIYLNRINLYRQRIWTCKVSGKVNLTYEEALVSEKHATKKVPEIPEELMAMALHTIQFSMLSLKDLADKVAAKLQETLFIGAELHGKREKSDLCPCKILKVLGEGTVKTKYEVAWLDRNKKVTETAIVNRNDLIWKKSPFSRNSLKPFIRKSTYRSFPWVLHDKLAEKYRISRDPPQDLKGKVFIQDGIVYNKRKKDATDVEESGKLKKKKVEGEEAVATGKEDNQQKEEPIKYPIDDLLVQPGIDDPVFTARPLPSRDFKVPMDCVGDLLMAWDFCSSFCKLLHLSPFSLEDFENAICHKGSNVNLIVETHSSLLRLLKHDKDEYFSAVQKRIRSLKITLTNWTEYLCDFVEIINVGDFSTHITTIKRGHYGLLDAQVKLGILRELVNEVLETDIAREKLAEYVEERQVLLATKRGEALEEGRKKREKEQLKAKSVANGVMNGHGADIIGKNQPVLANGNHIGQNGQIAKKKGEIFSARPNNRSKRSESSRSDIESKKTGKKKNMNVEGQAENVIDLTKREALILLRDEKNTAAKRSSKEQRREYFEREIEKRILHTNPLGKDRDYNRYWWFKRDGRMFVESSDSKLWGYYCCKEEIDLLMGSLNPKGEREKALRKQVEKFYSRICMELQKRSKDLANRIALEEAVQRRSTRVRALPRENPANVFLNYVNKWKED
ncbi:DDT domain-containing protein [Populus alba x Populus x berolinensis]|nr:DDT domain-containing protein [Populus alba x Populus x berolinensis]